MVIYNLMNHLKNFWPDLESNRRGEWEGRAQREREKEKLREWKSSISFRGGVYILPSAKALNSCHKDTHAYTPTHIHTPCPTGEFQTIMVSFSQFERSVSPTPQSTYWQIYEERTHCRESAGQRYALSLSVCVYSAEIAVLIYIKVWMEVGQVV